MTDLREETAPSNRAAGASGSPNSRRIAVISGDGIGPEVTAEALRVIGAVKKSFPIEEVEFDLGAERYLRNGEVLPDSVVDELASFDAIFLGAVGDPRVEPGILETKLLLRLRQHFEMYVNLRPAKLFDGVPATAGDIAVDLVVVRENTEGLYSGQGQAVWLGTDRETATEISVNTAVAVNRIVRYAFELASQRGGKLTLAHKTNVLRRAGSLYQRIFEEVSGEYPSVITGYQHVDAAAYLLVRDPSAFDVIVTDNFFGDILSDLVAGLVGGIGLVGSGNINPGRLSMFEPVHGSAPGIAGTGRANPIGAILSGALMLRHLGEHEAAQRVENAVARVAGKVVQSSMGTKEAGELVAEAVA